MEKENIPLENPESLNNTLADEEKEEQKPARSPEKAFLITIIQTVVWAAAFLAAKWFGSELFLLLFLGIALVYCALLIWLFVILIYAVLLIKHIKKLRFKIAVPFIIIIPTVMVLFLVSFETPKLRLEHFLYKNARENIVADIREKNLTPDNRKIALSGFSKFISVSGEVYIYENTEERIVVGFYVSRTSLSAPDKLMIYSSDGYFGNVNWFYSDLYNLEYIEFDENWRYYYPVRTDGMEN